MGWTKRAVIVGVFLLGATPARAFDYWGMNGAGCTPGDPAIQANRYFITAGSVNYRAGAGGLVTLYCPITKPPLCDDRSYVFTLNYRDSDGAGNAVNLTAQILKLRLHDGLFDGAVPGAQIFSNFSDVTTSTSQVTPFFEYAFDANYYYVRVDMNRAAGTSHVATFYGVNLMCF